MPGNGLGLAGSLVRSVATSLRSPGLGLMTAARENSEVFPLASVAVATSRADVRNLRKLTSFVFVANRSRTAPVKGMRAVLGARSSTAVYLPGSTPMKVAPSRPSV